MNVRHFLLICLLGSNAQADAQVERWMTLFDGSGSGSPDVQGSVALYPDTTYRAMAIWNQGGIGHLRARAVAANGDTLWTTAFENADGTLFSGSSTERLPNGTWLWTGGLYPGGTGDPDAIVYCFSANGDTLWQKRFITPAYDGFNAMCITPDGGACFAGLSNMGNNQFYVACIDANGDSLWGKTLGSVGSENAYSIVGTMDGGFIVAGYKVQSGGNYDMHVMRLNSNGDLVWQKSHGSTWSDNAGFACELPDGRILMAGGERASANGNKRPALYLLNSQGNEIWSEVYVDATEFGVFFAIPILMENGDFVISGSQNVAGTPRGMLVRTDSLGQVIWKRLYQTNETVDSYTYNVHRALDGGFILAGTAFDSSLISQDAWLVKVDSFGCLVPGCQVFDSMQEQVTDLRDALQVFPNPASEQVTVRIDLPDGFKSSSTLRLALVSAEGKLVYEQKVSAQTGTVPLSLGEGQGVRAGLYFVHLLDGTRWLSGTKLVVQ